jgi:rRNA-processing protein FCF1
MRIILDANFLVYCAKQKIDYLEIAGEKIVLSPIVLELEKLAKKAGKGRDKDSAKLALSVLKKNVKKKKVKIMIGVGEADKAIIEFVKRGDAVATMDRGLKRELKGKTKILSIRKGKKLEIL